MPQTSKQRAGQAGEDAALQHLQSQGLVLIERNFHCRWGEIDLILKDADCVVFVEVRLRKNNRYGGAAASVDQRKQNKLRKTALHYLQSHRYSPHQAARIDVVAVSPTGDSFGIDWIANAVEGLNAETAFTTPLAPTHSILRAFFDTDTPLNHGQPTTAQPASAAPTR